jgi:hypothetical protein
VTYEGNALSQLTVGISRPAKSSARSIVVVWLSAHVYIATIGLLAAAATISALGPLAGFTTSWHQFDTYCYESVAQYGYLGSDRCTYNTAFFPALPGLMWLGAHVGLSASAAGLLVSLAASLAAGFALARLAENLGARGDLTVAIWMFAPMAVFLFAPYTEALFAAFSFWAWLCARRGQWVSAGVLAGLASTTRSNALFLAAALILMFLLTKNRPWVKGLALLLPFVVVIGYFAYLHSITGSWTHWFDIQTQTWNRQFTDPLTSSINTIRMAMDAGSTGFSASRFVAEFANTFIALGLGVVLLFKRWWPEAAYVFLTLWSFMTGEFFQSTPRATLILFPIWILLGIWATRYRWFKWTYFILAMPALAFITIKYVNAQWIA